ncbi:hypothetical protein MKK75_04770 [Methylobacterium sp. J-030]|uniref:hypothetical protein n=1 Tax=Methylobacterium sp. J-030 TaxID=2836627 RepID=UPI001FB89769|nr:hypothetical protein [Methylobacterium sp. J-030]MCJ2068129.1 hypothetical protein [Methylobacterium sp. J-030]
MDGLILDAGIPDRVAPYEPLVCASRLTAQVLAIALVVLLCAVLIPSKAARR